MTLPVGHINDFCLCSVIYLYGIQLKLYAFRMKYVLYHTPNISGCCGPSDLDTITNRNVAKLLSYSNDNLKKQPF